MDTPDTPIYSPYPADNPDPSSIDSALSESDDLIRLPWSLESLPGTIWCNVHTGNFYVVERLVINRREQIVPMEENGQDYNSIGFWSDSGFYIRHWVRIDHLSPSEQLLWYCFGIDQLRQKREKAGDSYFSQETFIEDIEKLAIITVKAEKLVNQYDLPVPSTLRLIRNFSWKEISTNETVLSNILSISMKELSEYTLEKIHEFLDSNKLGFLLKVPCWSIGKTQENYDIAVDYLYALFVGEKLFPDCTKISANGIYEAQEHLHSVQFACIPKNLHELAKTLAQLSKLYSDDDLIYEETRKMHGEILDFQDNLEEISLHFPELADNYLANFIHSSFFPNFGEEEVSEEELDKYYLRYPEQKYGFWKSYASSDIGYNCYVSDFAWIIPLGENVENVITNYAGFARGVPDLHIATTLQIGNFPSLVFNKFRLLRFPVSELEQAQKCAEAIYHEKLVTDYRNRPMNKITEVFLDAEGQILTASDQIAQYILFQDRLGRISSSETKTILEQFARLSSLVEDPVYVSCRWDRLNDSQFEDLCYDIVELYYHPDKMRKMGKSRSRDGGRDIVFEVPGRLGKAPHTWIAQCKLIRNDDSLTSGKIEVMDTIYQYGVSGFCVMTSGVIDSTLYDKLDGIARNAKQRGEDIVIETWSKTDLEHFLARHLTIYKKYFSDIQPIIQGKLL